MYPVVVMRVTTWKTLSVTVWKSMAWAVWTATSARMRPEAARVTRV